jgi:hypothetical protein
MQKDIDSGKSPHPHITPVICSTDFWPAARPAAIAVSNSSYRCARAIVAPIGPTITEFRPIGLNFLILPIGQGERKLCCQTIEAIHHLPRRLNL